MVWVWTVSGGSIVIENLVIRMVPWEVVEPVGRGTSWEIRVTLGRCFQVGDLWKGVLMGYAVVLSWRLLWRPVSGLALSVYGQTQDVTTSVNTGSHHLLWAYSSTQLI